MIVHRRIPFAPKGVEIDAQRIRARVVHERPLRRTADDGRKSFERDVVIGGVFARVQRKRRIGRL